MNIELDDNHVYRVDGIVRPGVTEVLRSVRIIDDTWWNEDALERGTFVHLATQLWDEGELDEQTISDDIRPYLEAWKRFRKDTKFRPVKIEERCYSSEHGYCGTVDRAGLLHGRCSLIDIKSGAIPTWARLQTAAYAEFWGHTLSRYAIQLMPTGKYRLSDEYTSPVDFEIFLSALRVYNWQKGAWK